MGTRGPLFRWDEVDESFSDRARLQAMLDFEGALARAEAAAGVIPPSAARVISGRCSAELFDAGAIADAAARAGNLAIPLVRELSALVARDDPEAARFVHYGATSQDAIDTGLVLQLRPALQRIDEELERLGDVLADMAGTHRSTVVAGRTWLQQAVPTSFGLKVAGWLDAVDRHRQRLVEQLAQPTIPWHTHRDRLAEVATALGLCTGTLGKIARDISLHLQTEVAEVSEPAGEGRGGSSTMPHKRNPVGAATVLAAATRVSGLVGTMLSAMVQEQERGLGGWQAEWEVLPELVGLAGGAVRHLTQMVAGLDVDVEKMRANLEVTHGLVFAEAVQLALRQKGGAGDAHGLVERSCERARAEGRHLREVLAADPEVGKRLPAAELASLFDPQLYLRAAAELIDRVLAARAGRGATPRAGRG
jgi:3-carboxy-cis,cis-muconate cycloisomerase